MQGPHKLGPYFKILSLVFHGAARYLDFTFTIEKDGKISTKLYDKKRDDFDFHTVNFPFLSSNIPFGPSYGVYISQLIRYARCCSYYDDFTHRHKMPVERLVSQVYRYEHLNIKGESQT